MQITTETPIELLKGITPERARVLRDAFGMGKVQDLLDFYPIRYIDKTRIFTVSELHNSQNIEVQLKGKIREVKEVGEGRNKRLSAKFYDGTGMLNLVWFKYPKWLESNIPIDREVIVFGKINVFNQLFSMPHPEIETNTAADAERHLLPVYPSSEKLTKRGLNQKFFRNIIFYLLQTPLLAGENLPSDLTEHFQLLDRRTAWVNIHFPLSESYQKAAEARIKFEEAFFLQLSYGLKKQQHKATVAGHPFTVIGDYFHGFYHTHLPFELTNAQKRVLKEIREDMKKPVQMNRLLQGDVGSGKTIVALLCMLLAMDNNFQSCLIAPTEILAQQHYAGLSELLKPMGIHVRLLTGSSTAKERRDIHDQLQSGELPILIGTHAVLEETVRFKNLGLAIIDEQHRFGVAQRARLWAKNATAPHILLMTATPIPRTLAMSFYSDLDVSVIDELPANRKTIVTAHRREKDRLSVYHFVQEELQKGRQAYFVYPLIEESEVLDYRNLMEGYGQLTDFFKNQNISVLHGRMTTEEKEQSMQHFKDGKTQIMVATTVIEVGVNVPNASVMVIESAERFGLSQLHQLRGRVGRGGEQSYCILMSSDKLSADSRKRLRTMVETTDGFKISEVDMELRGPGDILGTQQSGAINFKKLNLLQDGKIIKAAKRSVDKILEADPHLNHPKNQVIKHFYLKHYRQRHQWSRIS